MSSKEIFYQGLAELDVLIEDTSLASPDYFRILKMPSELTLGINTFRFAGNADLFPENTPIYVEILDYNGNPVYYEASIDTDSLENIAIVSIYITSDTAPGLGTVIICSTASKSAKGADLDTTNINVRWKYSIYINTDKRNETGRYLFYELPLGIFQNDERTDDAKIQQFPASSNTNTVSKVLNSGSYFNSYVTKWNTIHSQPFYILPFGLTKENAIIIHTSAIAEKHSGAASDNCNLALLFRVGAILPQTNSNNLTVFGNAGDTSDTLIAATSGSIASGSTVLGTRTMLTSAMANGTAQVSTDTKAVIYLPDSVQDKIIYVKVEYAVIRLPYSSTNLGSDFRFNLRLGSTIGMIGSSPETILETESIRSNAGLIYTNVPIGGGVTIQDNPAS